MRLTSVVAESVRVGNLRFSKGEWTDVPSELLHYFLAEECPYLLREERCIGLYHVRYTGDKRQKFVFDDGGDKCTINAVSGGDYAVRRHDAARLLRRQDFIHTPPSDLLPACDSVVIIRHGGLGDVLLSMPMVRQLKATYPKLVVDYATSNQFMEIPRRVGGCGQVWDVGEVYEQAGYDAVFDVRMLVEAAQDSSSVHRSDIFARRLELTLDSYAMPYSVTDTEREEARALIGSVKHPVVGVQVAGSIGMRTPSVEKMEEIVSALDCTCVMLDHRADDRWDGEVNLTGRLTVPQLFAVVSECDAVLAGDSGVLHVSNSVGTPVVGLFGSVSAGLRVKDQPNCTTIQCNEFSGCPVCNDHQFNRCTDPSGCLDAVPTDLVVNSVRALL